MGSGGVVSGSLEVSDGKPETCGGGGIGMCEEEDDAVEAACCLAASA